MEIVVVVELGKYPRKEFFKKENLEVVVATTGNLIVREGTGNNCKTLAIFRYWEYYRITK